MNPERTGMKKVAAGDAVAKVNFLICIQPEHLVAFSIQNIVGESARLRRGINPSKWIITDGTFPLPRILCLNLQCSP